MNEEFQNPELKNLPEQQMGYPKSPFVWSVSREFRQLIEGMPYYSAVLREDGNTVRLSFARSMGYLPDISLEAYFKGSLYAKIIEKSRNLYVPERLEARAKDVFQKSLEEILKELQSCDLQAYRGTSADLMNDLRRADEER